MEFEFNPLITIPNPRKIPQFKDQMSRIKLDKLWVSNYPAHEAYPIVQQEFLKEENSKYTHLIFIPDDLIVTKEKLDILINDIKEIPISQRYKSIVAGYCNIDIYAMSHLANISFHKCNIERGPNGRQYDDYKFMTLEYVRNLPKEHYNQIFHKHLFKVGFNGFASWIIPRSIMEKFKFRNDSPSGYHSSGCCWDVMACHDVHNLGVTIYTDQRVEFYHMRDSNEAVRTFQKDKRMIRYDPVLDYEKDQYEK
jgi:hypothetical protein